MTIKKLVAFILSATFILLGTSSVKAAIPDPNVVEVFAAVAPDYQSPDYAPFVEKMMSAMWTDSLQPASTLAFPLIPLGSTISAANVITFDDTFQGAMLLFGVVVRSAGQFGLDAINVSFSTPSGTTTRSLGGTTFGLGAQAKVFGPTGEGSGDTMYTLGSSVGLTVNKAAVIRFGYTYLTDGTRQSASQELNQLYGDTFPLTVQIEFGGVTSQGTINIDTRNFDVPEPNTCTITGLGFAVLLYRLRKKR